MKKWLAGFVLAGLTMLMPGSADAGHRHRYPHRHHHGARVYRPPVVGVVPYSDYRPYCGYGVPGVSVGIGVGSPWGVYRPVVPVGPFGPAPMFFPGYGTRTGGVIIIR
jgi:hypothetical protein